MSADHVQTVRAFVDALNDGVFSSALQLVAPDGELDMTRALGLNRGVYALAELPAVIEEFNGDWESVYYGADEFIDAGEHVVVPFTNHLRGRDGIEVQARGVWVLTIRDGRIAHTCLYQGLEEALADVGAS